MKVCYVLSTTEVAGGANRSLLDLLGAINRKNIEPIVLISKHGDIEIELKKMDIPSYIIPYTNAIRVSSRWKNVAFKLTHGYFTRGIEKFLKEKEIDIVHNNSIPVLSGMEAAYRIGIPYICHIREDVKSGLGTEFLKPTEHMYIVNHADKIICISNFIQNQYHTDSSRTLIISDGLNEKLYVDKKKILEKDKTRISVYGGLHEQKNQLIAVKAMKILQDQGRFDFVLDIVGNNNTSYGKIVQEYINEYRIKNVLMVNAINDVEELKQKRFKDDINLICSTAEGLGRITIESMLSGSLTVAANAGATPEIIESEKTGILFNPYNEEELAEILVSALSQKEKMRQIAYCGQKYAEKNYAIQPYAKEIESVYFDLLQQKKCQR